jgi:AcrR family transcriptional regulator
MNLFENLTGEKQCVVLNAAYTCFGKNGYKKTSMADIAIAADISKASLFQYFGTKKDMYRYLYRYAVKKLKDEIFFESDDLFIFIENTMKMKLKVMAEYPAMFEFMASTLHENNSEIKALITSFDTDIENIDLISYGATINWAKFKIGFDKTMVMNTLSWINEGYLRSIKRLDSSDEIVLGLSQYLNFIKSAVYQNEYL